MLEEECAIGYDRFGFALHEDESDYDQACLGEDKRDEWKDIVSGWDNWKDDENNLWQVVSEGIPNSMRRKAWLLLTGAKERMEKEPGLFERIEAESDDSIQPHHLEALKMDLHRTFPDHALFEADAFGQQELERVLKATVRHLPSVGYCQGMSFVAAVLLMFMEADEAFYTLIILIEKHLARYYSPLSPDLRFDSKVLWTLVREKCPAMAAHVERERLDALVFATPWFTSLFSCYIRSWPLFLRFFDLYCLEGEMAIYRFGTSFLSHHQDTILQLTGIETLLPFLQNMGSRSMLDGQLGDSFLSKVLSNKDSIRLDVLRIKSKVSLLSSPPSSSSSSSSSTSSRTPSSTINNRKRREPSDPIPSEVPRTPSLGRFTEGFSSLINSVKKQCTEMFTPTPGSVMFTPSSSRPPYPSSVLRSSTRPSAMSTMSTQRHPYPPSVSASTSVSASVTRSIVRQQQRMAHPSSPTSTPRVRSSSGRRPQQEQQEQSSSMFSCSFAPSPTSSSMTRHPSAHRRIIASSSSSPSSSASPTTLKKKRPLPLHLMNQTGSPTTSSSVNCQPTQASKTVTISSPQDKENEDVFGTTVATSPSHTPSSSSSSSAKRPRTPLSSRTISISKDHSLTSSSPTQSPSPSSIRPSRIVAARSKMVSPSAPSSIRRSRMISPSASSTASPSKLRISSPSVKQMTLPSEIESLSPGPALMKHSTATPLHRLRTDAATLLRSPYLSHRSYY